MFPIIITVLVGTLVPFATPLIGMLMLGNLMKESGAVERLTKGLVERDCQHRHPAPGVSDWVDNGWYRLPKDFDLVHPGSWAAGFRC